MVASGARAGRVQSRAGQRDGRIDRQDARLERGENAVVHPTPEPAALFGIAPLDVQYADLQFHEGKPKDTCGLLLLLMSW